MTLHDANRVYRGWRAAPPTHRLAASFMGYKPPARHGSPERNVQPVDGVRSMLRDFKGGMIR